MGVTSEQDCRNMNRFVVSCAFLAVAMGAPSHVAVGSLGYAGQVVSAPVAHAPAVVGQTHHSYAAGPAVVENKPVYGVVGQRTVQTGEVSVVAGHQYAVAGVEHIPQPATSYVAGAPQNLVETRALPAPVIPAAPAPYAAIPPAPVPAGPAPADTVTQTRIAAPVRSHTRITPQVTNIVPEVQVHKYNVDVPVAVPRAVPREIIVEQKVAKPYEVPVPRAVPVPAPYKVHPLHPGRGHRSRYSSPRCCSRSSCCCSRCPRCCCCPSCCCCWTLCCCPSYHRCHRLNNINNNNIARLCNPLCSTCSML